MKHSHRPLKTPLLSMLMGLVLCLLSPSIHADLNQNPSESMPLIPYDALYTVSWHGIRAGESIHRFIKRKDGLYHVAITTKPYLSFLPLGYVEKADFQWESGQITPHNYFYDFQEGRRHKQGNVYFNWQKRLVSNTVSDEPWQKPMPKDIQDKVTHAVQLRLDLLNGKKGELIYTVAEDDEIKPYHFYVLDPEPLTTKIGVLNTQKVKLITKKDRTTLMWLSIDHDYLPVKVEHYREGSMVGSGEIKSYSPHGV